jgi:hypothetical protein
MATIETIGDGLKTRLQTIAATSLRQVYAPDEIPDQVNAPPVALILPGTIQYHGSHGNQWRPTFRILVLMTKQDQPSALAKLLPLMEPTGAASIKAAIEGDRTLGGIDVDAMVVSNSGFGPITWAGTTYLGTEFEVEVIS